MKICDHPNQKICLLGLAIVFLFVAIFTYFDINSMYVVIPNTIVIFWSYFKSRNHKMMNEKLIQKSDENIDNKEP